MEEINRDKLKHLLGHWIEHNENHCDSFEKWIPQLEDAGFQQAAEYVSAASSEMEQSTDMLRKALESLE
ncbi:MULTISPECIES: hypothetical protein [Methanohalophilus]|jgi:rubrerythrin|uniref:DUF8180 domain-containing protein n=1 Tax=Methanohalophilus halophilus TaxID=2177 RepID=A0A1L3Q058_9EURY|nr:MULTISPECIES: hypothetical protein [Methanohalophilus]APH38267.1 hypothetical protein BHR79_01385 [Methanohalophilus halophilus]RNI10865.1 hypothetical protein EFE40_01405 [Methanohalophilus halophilus]SDW00621.1 hypothetical protein SAMN04515625_0099 [Methanohalophilus halophilus]